MPIDAKHSYAVEDLSDPVEILVDRWGGPHVYASWADDAFFAQGWGAARDRLWQIDLWRRRGLGLLSEAYGPSFVEKDRASRLFLYQGEIRRKWLSYGSDTKRVVTAFALGVNEYVRLTEEDPNRPVLGLRQLRPHEGASALLCELCDTVACDRYTGVCAGLRLSAILPRLLGTRGGTSSRSASWAGGEAGAGVGDGTLAPWPTRRETSVTLPAIRESADERTRGKPRAERGRVVFGR